jgi:hypothetical protein
MVLRRKSFCAAHVSVGSKTRNAGAEHRTSALTPKAEAPRSPRRAMARHGPIGAMPGKRLPFDLPIPRLQFVS